MDPIIAIAKTSALQDLLDAPEWTYCGNTICEPIFDEIRLPGALEGVVAWAVYDMLDLNITGVCQIYRADGYSPVPVRNHFGIVCHPDEPDSSFYRILKLRSCCWHDFDGWKKLAVLTGRRITFHRDTPFPGCRATDPIATFHPDGRIVESPKFLHDLDRTHRTDDYLAYKASLREIRIA